MKRSKKCKKNKIFLGGYKCVTENILKNGQNIKISAVEEIETEENILNLIKEKKTKFTRKVKNKNDMARESQK